MTAPADAPEPAADARDVFSTRVLPAPRGLVYRAFADPETLARWWGPEGFTSTFLEFDLRPGGAWRLVMHGPDGAEYPMDREFLEVAPGERVVLRHPQPGHEFTMTMDFADEAGGTRITWRMRFDSAEHAAEIRDFIAAANEQNLDRLEAQLAAMSAEGGRPGAGGDP